MFQYEPLKKDLMTKRDSSFEFVLFFTLISLSLHHRGKSKGAQVNKPNKHDVDKRECESSSSSDESEDDEELTIKVSWNNFCCNLTSNFVIIEMLHFGNVSRKLFTKGITKL